MLAELLVQRLLKVDELDIFCHYFLVFELFCKAVSFRRKINDMNALENISFENTWETALEPITLGSNLPTLVCYM